MSSSDGISEMGHGGVGEASVGGLTTGIDREAYEVRSCEMDEAGGPCRE